MLYRALFHHKDPLGEPLRSESTGFTQIQRDRTSPYTFQLLSTFWSV